LEKGKRPKGERGKGKGERGKGWVECRSAMKSGDGVSSAQIFNFLGNS